jgi:hypothetical protein
MSRYYTMLRCVVHGPSRKKDVCRKHDRLKRRPFNWRKILVGNKLLALAATYPEFRRLMRVAVMGSLEKDWTPEEREVAREMLAEWGWPSGTA